MSYLGSTVSPEELKNRELFLNRFRNAKLQTGGKYGSYVLSMQYIPYTPQGLDAKSTIQAFSNWYPFRKKNFDQLGIDPTQEFYSFVGFTEPNGVDRVYFVKQEKLDEIGYAKQTPQSKQPTYSQIKTEMFLISSGIVAAVYFLSGKKTWTIPVSIIGVYVAQFPISLMYSKFRGVGLGF